MQSLRELSGVIPVSSLSLKHVVGVVICLLVLVRKTQNSPLRLKPLELKIVVRAALDIPSLDRPSLIDPRFADFKMD